MAMSRKRVSSPSAAKIGAQLCSDLLLGAALAFGDMLFNVLHLRIPSGSV